MEVETREPGIPAEAGSNEAVLQEIRDALDESFEFEESDREWAEKDLKILGGDTWRQEDRQDRESDRRPCLSFPVLAQYVDQCLGDWRQNRADIVVRPAAGSSESAKYQTKDGKEIDAHEAWAGIIRSIHSESRADIAHDTALEHAVSNAFGHYRIITEYADDGFNQVIRVKRIQDQFSVFWDPAATEYDKSDARYCLIAQHIPVRRFTSEYPDKATSMDLPVPENMTPWYDSKGETVRVVEYFKREPVTKNRMLLSTGQVVTEEDMKPGELDALLKSGVTVAKERKVTDYKVTWYKASGVDVLEGPQDWAGKFIPVVSVWGKEEPTGNGQIRHRSLIRHAHDAARVHDWMRPLALSTRIPTPTGWTTMGDVKVGDQILDDQGQPTNVVGMSPVHIRRDCYRVTFDDGSSIVADADHPWVCERRVRLTSSKGRWKKATFTTTELKPGSDFIAVTAPLVLPEADLPIDPYVLGVWLGDGSTSTGRITSGESDLGPMLDNLRRAYPCDSTLNHERAASIRVHGLTARLREAGLIGDKHIPPAYLRASVEQRTELLRGLMDTDGTADKTTGRCLFYNTNQRLSDDFAELLRTLGIKAKRVRKEGRASKLVANSDLKPYDEYSFTSYENVFHLSRKREMHQVRKSTNWRRAKRYAVVSVEPVPSVPVRCVAIDAPSHLFLAGDGMVPTHNTAGVEAMALQPKAPFVVGQSQLGSHAHLWQTANTKNHAFLPYDDTDNKSPPQRQQPGFPGAGFFNEANTAREDIKAAVGIYDAALGAKSNETSGKAIIARQRESDTMSFAYIDNLARSMTYEAKILMDLAPKIYDTPQEMTMLMVDGSEAVLELYKPAVDANGQPIMGLDGKPVLLNDLTAGTYQCSIDTGPSYMTKRAESAESMLEFVRALPAAGAVAGDLIAKNLDWPGADQFAKRLKYLLPPEIRQAEDAEANGGQALPPEVQMQLDQAQQAMAAMQEQLQQMQPMLEQSQQALDTAQAKLEAANQKAAIERQQWNLELDRAKFDAEQQLAKAQAMFDDRLKQMEDIVEQTKRALEDQHAQRVAKVAAERESEKQTAAERSRTEQEGGLKKLIESLQAFQEDMADKYEAIAKATAAPRDVDLKFDDKGEIAGATVTPQVGKTEKDDD